MLLVNAIPKHNLKKTKKIRTNYIYIVDGPKTKMHTKINVEKIVFLDIRKFMKIMKIYTQKVIKNQRPRPYFNKIKIK